MEFIHADRMSSTFRQRILKTTLSLISHDSYRNTVVFVEGKTLGFIGILARQNLQKRVLEPKTGSWKTLPCAVDIAYIWGLRRVYLRLHPVERGNHA